MNVQVTEEAFSSQKRPSTTSKHELGKIFLLLWVIFALLDPYRLTRLNPDPIRIRNPAHRSALQAHAQLGRICDQHEDEWDFLLDVMRVSKGKKRGCFS
jgi:hypothetical protein